MTIGQISVGLIALGTFVGMAEGGAPLFAYLLVAGLYLGTYAFFRAMEDM